MESSASRNIAALLYRIDNVLERIRDGQWDENAARDLIAECGDALEAQAEEIAKLKEGF